MTMMEELTLITCGQSFKKKITSLNVKIKFYGRCNIFCGDHIKKIKIDKNQTWIKCSGHRDCWQQIYVVQHLKLIFHCSLELSALVSISKKFYHHGIQDKSCRTID